MDPLSLVAMASTTFKGLQVLVSKGAEIEHVAQKLGHWYTLVSDINQAEREAENPPLFKKMFDGSSVEEQALNAVIAKKKIEEQEKQVRELITWAYGVETYREMIHMRKEIRAKRERMIYKQRRRQRVMLDMSAVIMGLIAVGGIVYFTVDLIQSLRSV
nr:peptidase [uncultured Mediterranean phage uvMED]BAR25647.1 peptidase [uncultured Mediterranean phage uvMED]